MPGGFRTPLHGTRAPSNPDADAVAQQIADSLAEHQREQIAGAIEAERQAAGRSAGDAGLTLVLTALDDLKRDVRQHGTQLNAVMVEMATMNGEAKLTNQSISTIDERTRHLDERVTGLDDSVKTLSNRVERGSTSATYPTQRNPPTPPRGDGTGWISTAGLAKLISAVFLGLAGLVTAYMTGRGHGAQAEKDANPPAAHAPAHSPATAERTPQ